ncbi:MFS-type transporter SLC18B1-like [Oppia nitens]|uniref:MFS-type transporter SLC18B1-like n=1 Tax=Oppia nitens TaxID=1686743 RepID=UPI0023DA650B|nr:MFS-type transporter SLC18B1-like [Oppia nitens]
MNRGSIYRRRSSAFYYSSFAYQNRRASNIQVPATFGDCAAAASATGNATINDDNATSYQNENYGDQIATVDMGQRIRQCIEQRELSRQRKYRRLLTTVVLCYGNFCVGSAYSILGPLFPTQAKLKDISETWIGLIMAQFEVAIFFGSIIFGKLMSNINPKHALIGGQIIAGLTCLLFG